MNRVGVDPYKASYSGHSQVLDPMGDLIASAPENEEGWVEVHLSKKHLSSIRKKLPFLSSRDEFDLKLNKLK